MGSTNWARGVVKALNIYAITLSPVSVANATSAEQTFTVASLALNDFVALNKPTAQAGLGIVGCRVSAANTLAITFMNATAATITPTAAEAYILAHMRSEYVPLPTVLGAT